MATYTIWPSAAASTTINESLVKEDVSDFITNMFPLDTPLQQVLDKVPMNNVFTEQPVDTFTNITRTSAITLATSNLADMFARPEGYDSYTTGSAQYPARLKSVAEIQAKMIAVSGTDRTVSQYAIGDRFDTEALKVTQSVVNDFEHSFWWSAGSPPQGTNTGDAAASVRHTQGLMYWILKTGLERFGSGVALPGSGTGTNSFTDGHGNDYGDAVAPTPSPLNVGAMTWAYNANGVALDRGMFMDNLMGKWYSLTGRQAGAMGFASPRVKNLFSTFALSVNGQINERTIEAASKMLVDTVDWYETDYGVVSINMSRYLSLPITFSVTTTATPGGITIAADECLAFIKPEYYKIGVVRPVSFIPLAKTGDLDKGLIIGEQALICRNPQAGVAVVNCIP